MTLLEYVLLTKEKGEQKSYFECLHKNYGKNLFEKTEKQLIEKEMLEDLENEYEREKAHRRKYPKGMTLLEYVLLTKEKGDQKSYFECLQENYGNNYIDTSLISRIITNHFFREENINFEVLDLLVENGANVNDSKGEYGPPLLASICFKKEQIFHWLVEREDIDLTAHDKKGNALHKLIGEWNDNTKLRVERMLENFMQKAHSKGCLHDLQEQKSKKRDLKPCKTDMEKVVLHKKFEDLSKKYKKRDELYKAQEGKINIVLKELFNGNVSCPVNRSKLEEFISDYKCPVDVSTCEGKLEYGYFANLIKKLCNSMEYETFKRVFEEKECFQHFIADIKSIKKGDAKKKTGNVKEIQDEENVKEIKGSHSTTAFSNSTIGTVIINIQSPSHQLPPTTTAPTIPTTPNPAPANVPTSGKFPVESEEQTDNQNQISKTTGRTYAPADGSGKLPVESTDRIDKQTEMALVAGGDLSASDSSMKSLEKELALRQSEFETGNRNDDVTNMLEQLQQFHLE